MSFDKNKTIEYMSKVNDLTPKIIILLIVCWIATPILMSIGTATKLAIFSFLGFLTSFASSILFWGLIICIFIRVAKNNSNIQTTRENTANNEYTPEEQEYSQEIEEATPQEQEYISQMQEYNYAASYNTSEVNYAMSDEQAQKQFEREMFAMQHPILSVLRSKIIPFIWFLAILCIIIAGVIYMLDYVYGVKLHF